MNSKLLFVLIIILVISTSMLGQNNYNVSGFVFNSSNNNPIGNVNVLVRGTDIGTTTDSSGYFKLNLEVGENFTIVFSHLSYEKTKREIFVGNKKLNYKIYLNENNIELPEVTIKGKQSFDDKRALWSISGNELEELGEKNLEKALIYLFPEVVYPLKERMLDYKDFTLYVNGEWFDTIYLEDFNPYKIKYIKIWKAWRESVDMAPRELPLRVGKYVMLIVTN